MRYGVDVDKFTPEPNYCILCGLCVRYCAEVKGKCAIGFVGRGVDREVMFQPEIAARGVRRAAASASPSVPRACCRRTTAWQECPTSSGRRTRSRRANGSRTRTPTPRSVACTSPRPRGRRWWCRRTGRRARARPAARTAVWAVFGPIAVLDIPAGGKRDFSLGGPQDVPDGDRLGRPGQGESTRLAAVAPHQPGAQQAAHDLLQVAGGDVLRL